MQLSTGNKIRVLLADDHMAVRMGLITAIGDTADMEVVADVEDGRDAIDAYRRLQPDVVVVDLRMQGMSGIETIRALKEEFSKVRVLVFSNYAKGDEVFQAIKGGASGFVAKDMALEVLLDAVRTVYAGEQYIPPQIAMRVGQRILAQLSPRELDVLRLVGQGLSNKEIAGHLGLVVGTVKIHVANIFDKLGVSDRTQALVVAVKRGIIAID